MLVRRALLALLLAFATRNAGRADNEYVKPALLAEPAELVQRLPDGTLRVLDTRSREKYQAGHVPGAVWVDAAAWAKAFDAGKDAASWARRIGQVGMDTTTRVVVYGDNLTDAARVWWILRYWGVRDVQLLNGGWQGWQAAGGNVTKEEPRVTATTPRLEPQAERLATLDEVLANLKTKKAQAVDARSRAEYCGDEARARRAGSIPGAVHLEWTDLLDLKTQHFKAPADLARTLTAAGIKLDQPVVSYCQSGGRSAVMAFALELMGGKEVRNYYGSWAEWGNAEHTPVVKPK